MGHSKSTHPDGARRLLRRTANRIAVIKKYVKLSKPTAADADEHARLLGLGRSSFYLLVRSYQENRIGDEHSLAFKRPSRIDSRTEQIILDVINELGSASSFSALHREAIRRCSDAAVPNPTQIAVRNRLDKARKAAPGSANLPLFLLGSCYLKLHIRHADGSLARSLLTALFHGPTGQMIGHFVHTDPVGAREVAAVLLNALEGPQPRCSSFTQPRQLDAPGLADALPDELIEALAAVGIATTTSAAAPRLPTRIMTQMLGSSIGRISLAPHAGPALKTSERVIGPVTLQQARPLIGSIVQRRNTDLAELQPNTLLAILGQEKADVLKERLHRSALKFEQ